MEQRIIKPSDFSWQEMLKRENVVIEGTEANGEILGRTIPWGCLTRDMSSGSYSQGGATVETEVDNDQVIDYLRPLSVCSSLGAEIITGIKSPQAWPVIKGDSGAQWLSEFAPATESDLSVGQVLINPHRLTVSINYSYLLQLQATGFDNLVSKFIARKLMLAIDQAAIAGTGGVQPIGVLNTTGIGTVTFGGTSTWANVVAFEKALNLANVLEDGRGWVLSPATVAKWRVIQKAAGTSTFLLDDTDRSIGYAVGQTTTMTGAGDVAILGRWSDVAILLWGDGITMIKNPYTLSPSGEVQCTFVVYADIVIKHGSSFCVSTDSGAQ